MSVDIHWDALTNGPDGERIAETVRAFIHERFQQVTLPRFIRAVQVHAFDFGSIPPKIEIKDICDPLPDFYNERQDGYSSQSDVGQEHASEQIPGTQSAAGVSNAHTVQRANATAGPNENRNQARDHVLSADTRTRNHRELSPALENPTSPLFANLQSPGFP